MSKDDIKIDVRDDAATIQGERKREHTEEREGVYRSERSYGSFYRVMPLPEGAITEQAKATFRAGVLEITMPHRLSRSRAAVAWKLLRGRSNKRLPTPCLVGAGGHSNLWPPITA